MTQPAKSYYRLMLGGESAYSTEFLAGGFIGADFDIELDLSGATARGMAAVQCCLHPVFLASHPGNSKIAAGPGLTNSK